MIKLHPLALASALLLSAAASAQNNPPPRPNDNPPPNNPSPNNGPTTAPNNQGAPNNPGQPNNPGGPNGPGNFGPPGGFGGPGGFGPPGGFNPGGPGGFGPGGGRGGFGGPGNFGPAALDTNTIKTLLQSSDEEWKVILPLLQNLITARQNLESAANPTQGRMGGGMPGNDSFGGPADNASGPGFGGGGNRGGRRGFGFAPPDPAATNPATTTPATLAATRPTDPALIPNLAATKPATPPKSSSLVQALADLQATVADKTSTEKQIKDRMALVRAARQKAVAAIQSAQAELRKLLTTDQEAALMGLGYLE